MENFSCRIFFLSVYKGKNRRKNKTMQNNKSHYNKTKKRRIRGPLEEKNWEKKRERKTNVCARWSKMEKGFLYEVI